MVAFYLQEKEILSALQSVLCYDNRSIETRWQVVVILWKIGQREESIKTWCKTRSINYKLSYQEVICDFCQQVVR